MRSGSTPSASHIARQICSIVSIVNRFQQQEVVYVSAGRLIEEWFSLLLYCQSGSVDQKEFKKRVDTLAKDLNRDQGEVSLAINQRLRRSAGEGA